MARRATRGAAPNFRGGLDYHVAFVQARAFFSPINWIKSDPRLQTLHLLTPSMLAFATPAPAGPSYTDRARMATQICYMYDDKGCGGPPACYRQHICRNCSGPHPSTACASGATAAPNVYG
ncbi:hypothetical protein B0H14DRAFT_3427319 [Mycena olivaceomarginata]|nr:hypothetical protein B0H14DRAFT_3427319 [Mycena olivaceomarginata]